MLAGALYDTAKERDKALESIRILTIFCDMVNHLVSHQYYIKPDNFIGNLNQVHEMFPLQCCHPIG